MDLSTVTFRWPAKSLDNDCSLYTQKRCSRKSGANFVAGICGVTQKVARSLVDQLPAAGTGTVTFHGVGQYGGFSWQTSVGVGFEYVNNPDVVDLIERLLALRQG